MEDEPILDAELQALIDGELDEARAQILAAKVAASAELSSMVAQYRADKEMILRAYGPLIELPVPLRLVRPLAGRKARPSWGRREAFAAVAAAAAIALVGWTAYPIFFKPADPLVAEAFAARRGDVRPQKEFVASAVSDPAARDRLAGDTLALPVKVPDLEKAGYVLTAIDIYRDRPGRESLQVSYRNAQGRNFTLYMHRSAGADRFDLEHRGATQICIWQNDALSVVMLGEMSSKDMLKLATLTYADLNF
jgi:anti-sigma factor RsiW